VPIDLNLYHPSRPLTPLCTCACPVSSRSKRNTVIVPEDATCRVANRIRRRSRAQPTSHTHSLLRPDVGYKRALAASPSLSVFPCIDTKSLAIRAASMSHRLSPTCRVPKQIELGYLLPKPDAFGRAAFSPHNTRAACCLRM
jgi:hypothetical protein